MEGDDSFGFSGDSLPWTVEESNVAVFMGVNFGIGTTSPMSRLQVSGGGLCVENSGFCDGKNAPGTIYANNTTVQGADYAEYFPSEEKMVSGDVVGLNPESGKVRRYRTGDQVIGVVSTKPGIIGGSERDTSTHTLVAILGQVPVNSEQTLARGQWITTNDGYSIGLKLSNGDVFLSMGGSHFKNLSDRVLELEVLIQEQNRRLQAQEKRYEVLIEDVRDRLLELETMNQVQ